MAEVASRSSLRKFKVPGDVESGLHDYFLRSCHIDRKSNSEQIHLRGEKKTNRVIRDR